MSNYPAKMAVVMPDFITVHGDQQSGDRSCFVYLNAFCLLKVERMGRGFSFKEIRRIDETGCSSVALLNALASQLDDDTTIAGHRLDKGIASMVQVPRDDLNEANCKPALLRLKAALANDVQDAHWYDRDRHRSLEDLARDYDLPAEWHRKDRQANPNMMERELSAKAQSVWLAVAHEWLTTDELRRAIADYDQWRTAHAIV